MRPTPLLAGLCAALLSLTLGGCAARSGAAGDPRTLVIGVGVDLPGLSTVDADGTEVGFDIDVARYVARGLGWSETEIEFRPIPASTRELALKSGEVDLVVGAYRITAESERLIDFAGPYLVGKQDLLVAADNADITGPHSLGQRTVCSLSGSPDAGVLLQERYSPQVRVRRAETLRDCVDDLLAGEVDAVTGDDVVLDGYASEQPEALKVVGSPFVEHPYGIGLPEGSPDVAVVDDLITEMIDTRAWHNSYVAHLGRPGAAVPAPPVPGAR